MMPLLSLLVGAVSILGARLTSGPVQLGFLPVALLLLGWLGTERIWYRRAYAGLPMRGLDLLRTTGRCSWRFFRLGLLVSLLWFLTHLLLSQTTYLRASHVVVDSDGRLHLSVRYPRCLGYVFVPPLAVVLISAALPRSVVPTRVAVAATLIATLVNLVAKGATARFYLRVCDTDVGEWGDTEKRPVDVVYDVR